MTSAGTGFRIFGTGTDQISATGYQAPDTRIKNATIVKYQGNMKHSRNANTRCDVLDPTTYLHHSVDTGRESARCCPAPPSSR